MKVNDKAQPQPFIELSEYKGNSILTMGVKADNGFPISRLSFGKAKAQTIVANYEQIKKFAEQE